MTFPTHYCIVICCDGVLYSGPDKVQAEKIHASITDPNHKPILHIGSIKWDK